ncbi:MAG: CoA pyrophosphatase [Bacteroidota bacterium]
MTTFPAQLQERLADPLPGQVAQYEMASADRRLAVPPSADARQAGVMALFYPKAGEWHLVFIQRTSSHPNDRHGGQIGFPGGKEEPTDENMAATALREVEEEIGVPQGDIELLGALSQLYIPVSNFLVFPYVGLVRSGRPNFQPQPSEVAAILEVPFSIFLDTSRRKRTDIQVTERITLKNIPYFDLPGQHVLWGATAMMMSELVAVAQSIPVDLLVE